MEERKNLHINQLMRAHDEAFAEMKRYYNGITRSNLELLNQLRTQIAEAREKVTANQKLMRAIADHNATLKTPLEVRGHRYRAGIALAATTIVCRAAPPRRMRRAS